MTHFQNYSQPAYVPGDVHRTSRTGLKGSERHDERGSLSGSEDGNYGLYQESLKPEVETEEGADLALTSQTLNADGTPKRPMNAFMIFARRRRPQMSAENQSMRTGEISKLLSKEWSTMPASEKQFYQDQAKLLKDSFNTKYPDYVYRRRPNNSRRRRRSDASLKPIDNVTDMGDEAVSPAELDSPTDGEEQFDSTTTESSSYSRASHEPPVYGEPLKYSSSLSRSATHPFQSNEALLRGHSGGHDSRLPFLPLSERSSGQGLGTSMSSSRIPLPHPAQSVSLNYSYGPPSSSSYSGDLNSQQAWQARMDRGPPAWLNSSSQQQHNDRAPSMKTGNYPGSGSGHWSSVHPSSSSDSPGSHSSYSSFPTLTSPFYPNQSSLSAYQSSSASSTPHYSPDSSSSLQSGRGFDSRAAGGSAVNDPLAYSARHLPRGGLPPVHSISGYSSHPSSTPTSEQVATPPSFWPRE